MHKVLTVLAEARPRHAFISFDARNAFNTLHRSAALRAVAGSPLGRVASAWYGRKTEHRYWDERGKVWGVVAERGLDQGCPLSPGLFGAALAPCLADLLDRLRVLDPFRLLLWASRRGSQSCRPGAFRGSLLGCYSGHMPTV